MRRWPQLLGVTALIGVVVAVWSAWMPPHIESAFPTETSISQSLVASGQVMPAAEVKLLSLVSSIAREVPAREGAQVVEGQVLLKLDDAEAKAAVRQASARLDAARAGKAELLRVSKPVAAAQLRQAKAQLNEARRRVQDDEKLNASDIVADVELDRSRTALAVAEASQRAALLQMRAASDRGSQSLSADAAIAQAQAQLALETERLAKHTLYAPVNGVLLRRTVEPGDAVLNGAPLFVVSSVGDTRIRIEPDERNLALLALGQEAIVSSEAFPEESFRAQVQFIAPAVDPQRGTIEVHLLVREPPDYLRPHMTVSVDVLVRKEARALTIPRSALLGSSKANSVFVASNGRLEVRQIVLGLVGDERVSVAAGLSQGDQVATRPQPDWRGGDRVRTSKRVAATDRDN